MLEQVCMVVIEVLGGEDNANTADITLHNSFKSLKQF